MSLRDRSNPTEQVVGYHVAEGVSLFNHHLMACIDCVPDDKRHPDNALTIAEAQRYDADGFAYVCDTCEKALLPSQEYV